MIMSRTAVSSFSSYQQDSATSKKQGEIQHENMQDLSMQLQSERDILHSYIEDYKSELEDVRRTDASLLSISQTLHSSQNKMITSSSTSTTENDKKKIKVLQPQASRTSKQYDKMYNLLHTIAVTRSQLQGAAAQLEENILLLTSAVTQIDSMIIDVHSGQAAKEISHLTKELLLNKKTVHWHSQSLHIRAVIADLLSDNNTQ
ncbi:hypothetical protein P6P90_02555 [Ectobacillus antri]|uniref:LXG domain-containing protein n=1 Tax=Ectobacillus antri TaxID=2486280 RepID=A0ABT6H0V7_9BACI|nr:hypothetical protein [Ectobacillus antri]MDG4656207.1 hypothetical protein [Ectobacillus antri]MDG5752882.1 hypothetical protein [Ectobacillus antri]